MRRIRFVDISIFILKYIFNWRFWIAELTKKSNAIEEIARNYKSAAELMIDFNSPNKAKSLLKKAMVNAVKTGNEDLISEINMLLASVA